MSAETLLSYWIQCPREAHLKLQVASQCAPVLKGIKASNLITTKKGVWKMLRKSFKNSRIVCIPLFLGEEREVMLLYRYAKLERHLQDSQVQQFLCSWGYEVCDVVSVIIRLRRRYQDYMAGLCPFPHELGVILEYPVEDVKSFIRHDGRNCILTSYWKVYHNLERAEEIFRRYDQARLRAMEEILKGCPLELLVEKDETLKNRENT